MNISNSLKKNGEKRATKMKKMYDDYKVAKLYK